MHLITPIFCIIFLCMTPYAASYSPSRQYRRRSSSKGLCEAEIEEPWSYRGENGPEYWGKRFPRCNGKYQSPIALTSSDAIYDRDLAKLPMRDYDIPVKAATIENNAHTVEITPSDNVERVILVRGVKYRLQQLHFHWGDKFNRGSEHTIDGMRHALELHLVHQSADEQTAVVAVLFKEQSAGNEELKSIVRYLPKVTFNRTRTELRYPNSLNLEHLLPENPNSFYHYRGSLTTPECDEGVSWFVMMYSLPVGKAQMAEFRKMYTTTKSESSRNCKMSNNFRPLQPLNHRKVFVSK